MARYDYRCNNCSLTFEVEHPMTAHPKVTCPKCGREAQRVFGASGIALKGTGFYNTDQRGHSSHSCDSCSGGSCSSCSR